MQLSPEKRGEISGLLTRLSLSFNFLNQEKDAQWLLPFGDEKEPYVLVVKCSEISLQVVCDAMKAPEESAALRSLLELNGQISWARAAIVGERVFIWSDVNVNLLGIESLRAAVFSVSDGILRLRKSLASRG